MLVSAHDGFPRWAHSGADFLEIDIRRNPDGTFILSHDEPQPNARYPTLEDALNSGDGLQLDLKEEGCEIDLITLALKRMAPRQLVVTTGSAESIRVVKETFPHLRAGLTLAEQPDDSTWQRVEHCHADFIALDHRYAKWYEGATTPVWLWTVDEARLLKRNIEEGWPEAIITNRPDLALRFRKGRA